MDQGRKSVAEIHIPRCNCARRCGSFSRRRGKGGCQVASLHVNSNVYDICIFISHVNKCMNPPIIERQRASVPTSHCRSYRYALLHALGARSFRVMTIRRGEYRTWRGTDGTIEQKKAKKGKEVERGGGEEEKEREWKKKSRLVEGGEEGRTDERVHCFCGRIPCIT